MEGEVMVHGGSGDIASNSTLQRLSGLIYPP
jgi:hypothetical protein